MFKVLETVRQVVEQSVHVHIDERTLTRFSERLVAEGVQVPRWDFHHHYRGVGEEMVSYLLVLDSINFCFWPAPGKPRWKIVSKSRELSGYFALAVSLKRALESGIPITMAKYLADLSQEQLEQILGGQGELQLLADRVKILNGLGQLLLQEYGGKAHKLVEAAQNSAVALVLLVSEKLTSFRDIAGYRGRDVFFYKRAQIFAADLYGALLGKDWGDFTDMDKITAFADYKLPQVLRQLGILYYEPGLAKRVDERIGLRAGSPEEIEIRANTVWAVELIRQRLQRMGKGLKAYEIDWILWNMGQREEFRRKPYHRAVSIFY